jgi:hypothetical protein
LPGRQGPWPNVDPPKIAIFLIWLLTLL